MPYLAICQMDYNLTAKDAKRIEKILQKYKKEVANWRQSLATTGLLLKARLLLHQHYMPYFANCQQGKKACHLRWHLLWQNGRKGNFCFTMKCSIFVDFLRTTSLCQASPKTDGVIDKKHISVYSRRVKRMFLKGRKQNERC